MSYATVLFDVGETLVHVPEPAPIYRDLLAACGRSLPLGDVQEILREVRRTMDAHVPRWVDPDLRLDCAASTRRRALHVESLLAQVGIGASEEVRRIFDELYVGPNFFTLYPDVPETLARLKARGYQLGIVSNWESRLLQLCAAHGIADYFDFAVVSELEGYVKPHPHMYRRALELAGVPAERVLHVGDSLQDDIEGAAAVGIRGVLVDRSGSADVEYEPRISSLTELERVLDGR